MTDRLLRHFLTSPPEKIWRISSIFWRDGKRIQASSHARRTRPLEGGRFIFGGKSWNMSAVKERERRKKVCRGQISIKVEGLWFVERKIMIGECRVAKNTVFTLSITMEWQCPVSLWTPPVVKPRQNVSLFLSSLTTCFFFGWVHPFIVQETLQTLASFSSPQIRASENPDWEADHARRRGQIRTFKRCMCKHCNYCNFHLPLTAQLQKVEGQKNCWLKKTN